MDRDPMMTAGNDVGQWLRPVLTPDEYTAGAARGELFERAGSVVRPARKLSQLMQRRPPGITGHQWSSAIRTDLDFVVGAADSYAPTFVLLLVDPAARTADAQRGDRMTNAVCEAVGLNLLRIESATLRRAGHGRRIVEYVIDARAFRDAAPPEPAVATTGTGHPTPTEAALGYRDIVGRLPDGRSGFVNDLGAIARAAAVEAYVDRQITDPIIRGLHVEWVDGAAEGWAWLRVDAQRYLFERVRLWPHGFSCGIEPGRLAEDLAVTAIGERLKTRDLTGSTLRDRAGLARDLDGLRSCRAEMTGPFAFEHVSFAQSEQPPRTTPDP